MFIVEILDIFEALAKTFSKCSTLSKFGYRGSLSKTPLQQFAKAHEAYKTPADEEEPFKFKYEARQKLAKLLEDENLEISIQAAVTYFIGKIDYETEDRVQAEQNMLKVIELLEGDKFNYKNSTCYIKASNELAIIWAERDQD